MRASLLLSTILLLACGAAGAEGSRDFGDLVIHYSLMPTTALTPEVARSHAITRSRNRQLLTVSVLEKTPDGLGKPIAARIEASATNLNGQLRTISLREVREGGAIYYLGELRLTGEDTFDFELRVDARGGEPRVIRFRRQLFPD
ncbi:MAG: DUF4426 domain-containing protein [Xanthomonadales bacterium]|nr:DUF4426 domain-containing protein [Xanthomonadales bacterium]